MSSDRVATPGVIAVDHIASATKVLYMPFYFLHSYLYFSQSWSAGAMGYAAKAAKKMALTGKAKVKMLVAQEIANDDSLTYSIPSGSYGDV